MTKFTEAQQNKLYIFFAKYAYCELRGTDDPKYNSDWWVTNDGTKVTKTSMLKNMRAMGLPLVAKLVKLGFLQIETVINWSIYVETDKFAELVADFDSTESGDEWTANRKSIAGWAKLVADGTVVFGQIDNELDKDGWSKW